MRYLLYAAACMVVLTGLVVGWKMLNPCKPPSEMLMQIMAVECLMDKDLRDKACVDLKGAKGCSWTEEDFPAIRDFIKRYTISCTKKKLEEKNYCSDKVEETLKGQ